MDCLLFYSTKNYFDIESSEWNPVELIYVLIRAKLNYYFPKKIFEISI